MKYIINKAVWSIALVIGLYTSHVKAQFTAPYLQHLEYSTNIAYDNSFFFLLNSIAQNNLTQFPFSSSTPAKIREIKNAVIDGYHRDSNGDVYFSFDVDTRINNGGGVFFGQRVLKSDIILCTNTDCSTFDYFFDSFVESFNHVNINAFTLDPVSGDLIFSIDSAAMIAGNPYLASDLIRYDGTAFSLEYGPIVVTNIAKYRNIDALSYTDNGKYLVSFANDGVLNDIYEYDIASTIWSIAYTPTTFGNDYNPVNISSLMITTQAVSDLIFSNGFE